MSDEHARHPEAEQVSETPSGEGFLSRWSRRKRETGEADGPTRQPPAPDSAAAATLETAESPPAELTDADMPALESLDEHSDYRGFLSPKVSEELRRSALRKLFGLPQFNVCDGLDDYAQDFTSFEPLGNLVTNEMRRLLERERDKLEQRLVQGQEPAAVEAAPQLAEVPQPAEPTGADPPQEPMQGEAGDPPVAGPGSGDGSNGSKG